jgi:hypothetical protein
MADPFWYVDGALDDVSPEERAALAAEAAEEWRAEEEANELAEKDRAERGERYEDWRAR